ncbi:hypothetical protein JF50_10165 [Pseudoalteromonas luteoviolacea]|uniref:Uncharacterized protein n=2 Tax=Pseudoalteromonas luteoviolacea TaxID=43657 RepID=A0A0C1MS54_9GAMM|nr:hypothetical protein JF50_10165 [Pseudoalteromonas luteoviolacea]
MFALSINSAVAASSIKQLDVLGQTVTFTLAEPKSHQVPNCVSAQNHEKWAVNLNSLQGQAMYSLLVTAVSKEQLVSVQSAQSCESISDIEQAKALSLMVNSTIASGEHAALYDGTGVKKVGKIILTNGNNTFYYVPVSGATEGKTYTKFNEIDMYFIDSACQGDAFLSIRYHSQVYYSERLATHLVIPEGDNRENSLSSQGAKPVYLYSVSQGKCIDQNRIASSYTRWGETKLQRVAHPVCGDKPCIIK